MVEVNKKYRKRGEVMKKILLPLVLLGLPFLAEGSLQPIASGQVIHVSGKILNELSFVSSDNQVTTFDVGMVLPLLETSMQSWFNEGNSIGFAVRADNPYGTGVQYSIQIKRIYPDGTTDYSDPAWIIQGNPSFEIFYNGVSTGYYFGSSVAQFTIAPTMAPFPAINVPANLPSTPTNVLLYRIPSMGNYFSEITSMSFTDAAGQTFPVGAAQIAALNAQFQSLPAGGIGMSIRVKNNNFVALFAGMSPYTLLSNVTTLGFPLSIYINNALVATIGSPLAQNNPNGPLLCALQK